MEAFLSKHGNDVARHRIKSSWKREGDLVTISFEVHKRHGQPWFTDPDMTPDWKKNWGLWNHDVVEAFLQLRNDPQDLKAPYLEIQVSPLNQPFALIITEPRKTFFPPEALDFSTTSEEEGRIWKSTLTVKLPSDLKGTHLYGGFFACLDQNPREYYALEVNPEDKPDFHRPELFLSLETHE